MKNQKYKKVTRRLSPEAKSRKEQALEINHQTMWLPQSEALTIDASLWHEEED